MCYSECVMVNENDDTTTIQLKKSVVKKLQNVRKYQRETYNKIITDLLKITKKTRTENSMTHPSIEYNRQK